ncbi:MAG: protein BatD [Bacteroidia bacterium]|nr:protein BatD [Bacteroidia bacterium]
MLAEYQKFAKEVGVIEMPKGYSASGEVTKKSMWVLFWKFSPYLLALLLVIVGLIVGIWIWRRKKSAQAQ